MLKTSDAFPGPPPVKMYGSLKTVKAPVSVMTTATKDISFVWGTVI